jgi:hypothetical protein
MSRSSMRCVPTAPATLLEASSACKQAVLAAKRAIVTVEGIIEISAAQPGPRDPAVLDHQRGGGSPAAPIVLRPRLLQARQRLLQEVGRFLATATAFSPG